MVVTYIHVRVNVYVVGSLILIDTQHLFVGSIYVGHPPLLGWYHTMGISNRVKISSVE